MRLLRWRGHKGWREFLHSTNATRDTRRFNLSVAQTRKQIISSIVHPRTPTSQHLAAVINQALAVDEERHLDPYL